MRWEEYKTDKLLEIHHPQSTNMMSVRHANFLSALMVLAAVVLLVLIILDAVQ